MMDGKTFRNSAAVDGAPSGATGGFADAAGSPLSSLSGFKSFIVESFGCEAQCYSVLQGSNHCKDEVDALTIVRDYQTSWRNSGGICAIVTKRGRCIGRSPTLPPQR